jgi:hypothetical protein
MRGRMAGEDAVGICPCFLAVEGLSARNMSLVFWAAAPISSVVELGKLSS